MLRNFDYNSEKYCYSQIEPSYVGIGISDSMNEKFHDLIKAKIPHEDKYIKIVGKILELIEDRNEIGRIGVIDRIPFE